VFSEKFGLYQWTDAEGDLVADAFMLMNDAEIDMTIFFRTLATASVVDDLTDAFYLEGQWQQAQPKWTAWFARYQAQCALQNPTPEQQAARIQRMNAANPKYVLRNYLAQQAIDAAHAGDASKIGELLDVMRYPYDEQQSREAFAQKRPDWARHKAGCSMLSCSS
jgi:serine/tyrosine/threonine adenylyltransferase